MPLEIDQFNDNPMIEFSKWFAMAKDDSSIKQPNAMCISTIDEEGYPDSRWVLMKDFDENSLVFYTNLNSDKGEQLKNNSKISVNFYWPSLSRQIRMQGIVDLVDDETADEYFDTRSIGSKIGSWASDQSKPLVSRKVLEDKVLEYERKFEGKKITRPPYWSGFKIVPHKIEFWESGKDRLHDRFLYSKQSAQKSKIWKIERLYP